MSKSNPSAHSVLGMFGALRLWCLFGNWVSLKKKFVLGERALRASILLVAVGLVACSEPEAPDQQTDLSVLKELPAITEDCVIDHDLVNPNYDVHVDWDNPKASTDFYLLVFSNSPAYCDSKTKGGVVPVGARFQCESANHFGWVVHGLWAENESAYVSGNKKGHPRFCQGDLPPVEQELLESYLCMSPATQLLQGEWEKHGSCSFEYPADYFNQMQDLYKQFDMPPADLGSRDAMNWMKDNHPGLKDLWLHLTSKEFGICFNAEFQLQSCPGMIQ